MKQPLVSLACVGVLMGAVLVVLSTGTASATAPLKFGMDANAIAAQTSAGVKPDYGTFWIGPWTLNSGWGGPDGQMTSMRSAGVTPAIHFYYWGDDISPSCVENGCWSSLHNVQKDRTHWEQAGQQLTDHLNARMGGQPVVVFLESEFNKGGIGNYEPFDGYLATMANGIHARYPAAQIVLGFGNWGSTSWANFDRAAAASDMVGLQGMRGSTKDASATYDGLYSATLSGVQKLQGLFHKPIMLTDIALSSYPEPAYVSRQSDNLAKFFAGLPALKSAGVNSIVYRSWRDSPGMALANYYGEAERHWGLAYPDNSQKAAGRVWIDGVKAERNAAPANRAPIASFTVAASGLTATVDATASSDPEGSPLSYAWDFGDATTATGATARHSYATAGTYTVKLTASDGAASASTTRSFTAGAANRAPTAVFTLATDLLTATVDGRPSTDPEASPLSYAWTFGDGSTATGAQASHTYATSGSYTVTLAVNDGALSSTTTKTAAVAAPSAGFAASFKPAANVNEWWIEVAVTGSNPVAKVEARIDGGAWTALPKANWGNYAKSIHAARGAAVVFRATDASGAVATSAPFQWLGAAAPTFTATFAPKAQTNNWWVETAVSASAPLSKVEARVNGGPWTDLPKASWGNYAKSIHVVSGQRVEFRATSDAGATATSAAYTWG